MAHERIAGFAGAPLPHDSAHLHVSGRAPYTDDIPEVRGTLHAAIGMSERAHARLVNVDLSKVRFRLRMFWHEQRTAILVGLNGDVVCSDASCHRDNLKLVIPDQRPKNRHPDRT